MTVAAIALLVCGLVIYAALTPNDTREVLAMFAVMFLLGMLAGRGVA